MLPETPQNRPLAEIISGLRLENTLAMQEQKGYSIEGDGALNVLPDICRATYRLLQAEGYGADETTYYETAELLADIFLAALERHTGSPATFHKNTIWGIVLKGLWLCFINDCPELGLSPEETASIKADKSIASVMGEPGKKPEDTMVVIDAWVQQLRSAAYAKRMQTSHSVDEDLEGIFKAMRSEKLAYAQSLAHELPVISRFIAEFDVAYDTDPRDLAIFYGERLEKIGPILSRFAPAICRIFGQPEPAEGRRIEPHDVLNICMEACIARRKALERSPQSEEAAQEFLSQLDIHSVATAEHDAMGRTPSTDPHVLAQVVRSVFASLMQGEAASPVLFMRASDCAVVLERMYQEGLLASSPGRAPHLLKIAQITFWEHILMQLAFQSGEEPLRLKFFHFCIEGRIADQSLESVAENMKKELALPILQASQLFVGMPAEMREQVAKNIGAYMAIMNEVEVLGDAEQFVEIIFSCIKQYIYIPGTKLEAIEHMLISRYGRIFALHGDELKQVFLPENNGATISPEELVHALAIHVIQDEATAAERGGWAGAIDDLSVTGPPRRKEKYHGAN